MAVSPAVFPDRPRVAVASGCALGEGPIWDPRTGTLLWVDIDAGALWRWRPDAGEEATSFALGEPVGFVQLTPDPSILVLGLRSGIARLDLGRPDALRMVLRPEPDRPANRLNDAAVAPDGSLFFGSMDAAARDATGRFYRWSPRGLIAFGEPAPVTNGPAIDPERGLLYCAETKTGRIFRHPLQADGAPGPRELFVTFGEGEGLPDGLTVDAEGHLWACHWGGARLTRFDLAGNAVMVVPMPTAQVTKAAFGGPDLATMYVTTAAAGRDREIDLHAGHVFSLEPGPRGRPASVCRMGLAGDDAA